MSKIDVNALPVPVGVRETHTFRDALQPGKEITLTFSMEPDYAVVLQAQSLGQEYAAKRSGKGAIPIQIGKKALRPSPEICLQIGIIQTLESPESPEDRYVFEEWYKLSRLMPNAFADIAKFCDELINKVFGGSEDVIPNDSAALGPHTSERPSNMGAETILT